MRFTRVALSCAALLLIAGLALAQGGEKKSDMKMDKAKGPTTFLIESPHTAEECLSVMDETNKAKELEKWSWGCMTGNHTAYRIVQAADESAALAMVPASVREKAKAYPITKMTPSLLEAAHKAHN